MRGKKPKMSQMDKRIKTWRVRMKQYSMYKS